MAETRPFNSLAALLLHRAKDTPDKEAFRYPKVGTEDWESCTWSQTVDQVREIASGLRALGLEDEQRVAIMSSTRLEWVLADMGILCAGGATTTIYPNNTAEECHHILSDSESVYAFAETEEHVSRILEVRDRLPGLKGLIVVDGKGSEDDFVISLVDLREKGKARDADQPDDFQAVVDRISHDRLATLIYTSGTTGKSKGVELTHDCWLYTGESMDSLGMMVSSDVQYLWLPMSHSFGKVCEVAAIWSGHTVAIDGRIDRIVQNLPIIQPTFMAAAPRIFEKVYNRIVSRAQESGAVKYRIFRWSVGVGREVSQLKRRGQDPGGLLGIKYKIADKLVFSKLRELFGGRIRFFISGSAPLSKEIAEFFHAAGLLVLEGYGLTESSAASFVNRIDDFEFGTVGKPIPGTEVKLLEEDNEILLRSRGIMRGYRNLTEKTAETLDDEKWLHTGDIGEIDAQGRLRITDRKKDLIKTSGGKYVAPQHLEGQIKASCPYVSQVLVHGNKRNFCSALITLDMDSMPSWMEDNGMSGMSVEDLSKKPEVHALIQPYVDGVNEKLARYETIKKFAILPADFAVETGELTASLKVKRKVVEGKYMHILDGFYEGALKQV